MEDPVLDIGAGQGRNAIYLSKLGYQVDATDPSFVSIHMMEEIKAAENLNFNTMNSDYKKISGTKKYSAILVFGLIQILDWEGIGPEHRHGNSPIEKHALVEAVFGT